MKTKVITYQSANGEKIDMTPAEIKQHEKNGTWPKNSIGQEYCQVSHGLHTVNVMDESEE